MAPRMTCSPCHAGLLQGWVLHHQNTGLASELTVIQVLVLASSSSTTTRIELDFRIQIKPGSWFQTRKGILLGWTMWQVHSTREPLLTCIPLGYQDRVSEAWWETPTWAGARPANKWQLDSMLGGYPIHYKLRGRSWTCQTICTRDTLALRTR